MKATITGVKKYEFPNKDTGAMVKGLKLHLQFKTAEVIGTACEIKDVTNSNPDMFAPFEAYFNNPGELENKTVNFDRNSKGKISDITLLD